MNLCLHQVSRACAVLVLLVGVCTATHAQESTSSKLADGSGAQERQQQSPWLLAPLISSNPKLGTSLGGLVGYVMKFDAKSEPSLFAVQGQWSNTSSSTVAAGAKLNWNENRDRLVFGAAGGKVSNDYLDFLNTGQEVRSDENIRAFAARYEHEFYPHLYFGVQAVYSNYGVDGVDATSDLILNQAGLTGVVSSGVGLVASYDTRDNANNTTDGMLGVLHNVAFRESLGSDASFDVYTADWRSYWRTGKNNVVVVHAKGRWSDDAPTAKQSTVELRGYTRGQYVGRNSLTLEGENRYMFQPKWGAKAFAGVSCLYGNGMTCGGDTVYPMVGGGVFYLIKPESNMVISAEFAKGSGDSRGFYLSFGHRF